MTDRKLIIRASLLYEFKLGTSASSWHLAQVLYARPDIAKMTLAKIAELNWEIMLIHRIHQTSLQQISTCF